MKIFIAILLIGLTANAFAAGKGNNTLSKAEKKSGWTLIFDGKTTNGWRGYTKTAMPEKGWDVVDGTLHCQANGGGGDIIFDTKLTNFELALSWKISEGGNSGIFIFGKEVEGKPIYFSAPEYQLLDDERHGDAKAGKNGNHKSASLYDMIPAVPQNARPALQWNEANILNFGKTGLRLLSFKWPTIAGRNCAPTANSKTGLILLTILQKTGSLAFRIMETKFGLKTSS